MSTKFAPTPAELSLVSQIFNQADPQKLGILTGDVAVKVFGGAKLQPTVLGEIWSIADEDNNGWLARKGVAIALRLIGWAQKGEKITQDLVYKPGPLPTIEGYTAVSQQNTGTPLARSPPPGIPPFTSTEKAKFQSMFNRAGPDPNGLLNGIKARNIFVKSKLSNDTLLQIWNLADTQDRGALDSTDFAIGMYFIQALMSGQLSFVPTTLPPGLYQQAGGHTPSIQGGSVRSHMSGNSGSYSPIGSAFPQNRGALQPQYTGQSQLLQPDHTGFSSVTSPRPPVLPARPTPSGMTSPPFVPQRNGHGPHWDVTHAEKANSDKFFDELDPQRRGFIEGEVAVPFMLKSNLPGEDLARIWDLADINNDGMLTRDGFAVAMYLIQKKLSGVEIPNSLPNTLVPPSLRGLAAASPFASPPQHQAAAQELARDLIWDDTPPVSAAPVQPSRAETLRSASTSVPASRDSFSSSAFTSSPSHHDLLGDDEDVGHTSPALHDQSADIGNTQNQLNSTNRALDTLKQERSQVEESLASQTSQLAALQNQLSTAKASYETETKLLATLRERYSAQTVELQKAREELIRAESELSAVRVEKAEVEGAFMRDKEDARELHRKMVEVGQQAEAMKAEVEKAKKDAKQQKGLLAIAKKQLSSKETEKARAENELEEAGAEVLAITKERIDAESELAAISSLPPARADSVTFAAAHSLPASPDPSSPTPSAKSNNPFDKFAKSTGTPRSGSPFLPFAGAAALTPSTGDVPTVTAASQASAFDPFGFSDAFETQISPSNATLVSDAAEGASRVSTPQPASVDIFAANFRTVRSPTETEGESDDFMTPPTTADLQRSQTSSPAPLNQDGSAKFPALDDAASKFPDLDTESAPASVPLTEPETDLGSKLKELDIEESDSDSDDDEVPLADLAAKSRTPQKQSPVVPIRQQTESAEAEELSFDDIFGVTPPITTSSQVANGASPAFGQSADTPYAPSTIASPKDELPAVAGVSAFDEAMGTIPGSAALSQSFTFDSAFEDNFDFDSAVSKPFPAAATNAPAGNDAQGFNGIFATPPKSTIPLFPPPTESPLSSTTPGRALEPSSDAALAKPTFDEAFSGFSGRSLNLNNSFGSPMPQETAPPAQVYPSQATFPSSPPTSSPVSPRVTAPRPVSPTVRTKSPPPRVSSPKPPRPSTSSSKEAHEKVKEAPTRSSKLSIRLPFGKKRKQQQAAAAAAEPLPLTPQQEDLSRTVTPAVDDDVEAVKTLSDMGFSRTQAVEALETYGYDVQKALNSLLGAP
ncbi:hypothetical protein DXG03_007227 [Asterophora parasitica]|uniref:Cytoskeletal adapter protein sagA n=1 Tax=Asterophora parasitica TaxID=117018 RepID=A0A9P7GAA4_9AGAR|nr:hypothetical protein DXG03_007227 [Asterophora parasitica]